MITGWKKTAIKNMTLAFGSKGAAELTMSDQEVGLLHAKIGQLVVERDFLSAASGLILGTGGKKRSSRIALISASGGNAACCRWRALTFTTSHGVKAPKT